MTVTPSELSTNQSPEELAQEADLDLTLDAELDLAIPEEVPTADDPSSRASRSDTDGVGFTLDEFASLLSKYDYNFKPGDVVKGTDIRGLDRAAALEGVEIFHASHFRALERKIG